VSSRHPPSTLICTLPHYNPSTDWHLSLNPPTALTHISPDSFPPFFFPSHPSSPTWSHPRVRDNTAVKLNRDTRDSTKHIISTPPYDTFHLFTHILTSTPKVFTGFFLLFKGQTLLRSGTSCSHSRPLVLFSALLQGLTYDSFSNHIHIFFLDLSLSSHLLQTSKHSFLPSSHTFINFLSGFLASHDTHHIDLFRYSTKWSGLLGMAVLDNLKEREQHVIFPSPPTPLLNPKARLLRDLQTQYHDTIRDAWVWQSIIPPDGQPPPFYIGALTLKDWCTSSASLQLATGYAFTTDYSDIFWANTGDTTLCPCSKVWDLAPTSSTPSFKDLQHLPPRSPTPLSPSSPRSHLPHHQRQQPRLRHYQNTTNHVLFHCLLLNSPHHHIFGLHANENYIFGTEEGGHKLGLFLRATNRLLRPLPP